jgi:F-type H+-transporting ATPase subunit b
MKASDLLPRQRRLARIGIISERELLNSKQTRINGWVWAIVLITALALAGAAQASEGGLVLVPEFISHFFGGEDHGTFWVLPIFLVFFSLLAFPANALLYKPIFRVLDERKARTVGTRQRAEKIMIDADNTLAHYERALREVREEAENDRKGQAAAAREESVSATAAARAESENEMERARSEISEALEEARQTLRSEAQELANEAASRVLGRTL